MNKKERKEFADSFDTYFTSATNAPSLEDDQWEILEVNVDRVLEEAEVDSLKQRFSSSRYTKALVELLARWLGISIDGNVKKDKLAKAVAENVVSNIEDIPVCRSLLFLLEFEEQKRTKAVFNFAKYFLPEHQYDVLAGNLDTDSSKRFGFILAVFLHDPGRLRSLMLYNQLEKAGTVRHRLNATPNPEENSDAEELIEEAQENVRFDVMITGDIDETLDELIKRSGKDMKCFDVFDDIEEESDALVFILRMKGETRIRQIDTVVFEEEAELFVMRFVDGVAKVDTHPRRTWDRELANAVIQGIADDDRLEYRRSRVLTKREKLQTFLREVASTDDTTEEKNEDVRLYQLKLENAPVGENPLFELRSEEKEQSLAPAVEDLQGLGVRLLEDLNDIETFGVTYMVRRGSTTKRYIFKIDVEPHGPNHVSLPYSDSAPPRPVCDNFEDHMEEKYDIRIFPGDRS
jgi:hypothetical protein